MRRILYGCVFSILSGSFIAGCATASQISNAEPNMNIRLQEGAASDKQLRDLLQTFSQDVGPQGQEAWRRLQAYPESQLISDLGDLERKASPAEKVRPQIAFVFCWLGRDCARNVKIIEAGLTKSSPYDGFYADDAQSMLSRLIERDQKDLLKPLFESTSWSDGALSEGLSETFARELQKDPEQFLKQLATEPAATRKKVYSLMLTPETFTKSESTELQQRLSAIPKTSAAYDAAQELRQALKSKTHP